jgi:hypothetical protein
LLVSSLVGCSGRALVHTVPLGTQKISTEGPMLLRESMDECFYWTDEQNRLLVAMRKTHHSLFGRFFDREFVLTFVLPGVPAAASRDYRMDRNTARLVSRSGIYPQRGGSTGGIVAVWDYGKGSLKGRFRFNAKQQTYSVLTGWSGDFTSLYLGEFTAVNDPRRGKRLLTQIEEAGLARKTRSVSKDAGAPSTRQEGSRGAKCGHLPDPSKGIEWYGSRHGQAAPEGRLVLFHASHC